jgi:hypothetical protein
LVNKWRPENWDSVWQIAKPTPESWGGKREVFEAGADAMLEALSKIPERGYLMPGGNFVTESGKRYKAIFIPD